ncbi:hypothetical protein [Desulfonatronum parangueonense]
MREDGNENEMENDGSVCRNGRVLIHGLLFAENAADFVAQHH